MKEKLNNLLNNSYSPYSNFRVSAIVVMNDGKEFNGVNIENASYGATICAERVAIYNAIANGYKKDDFAKLYVMVDSDKISSCCFLCRQVISELMSDDVQIFLMNRLEDIEEYTIKELCPLPFNKEDLQ